MRDRELKKWARRACAVSHRTKFLWERISLVLTRDHAARLGNFAGALSRRTNQVKGLILAQNERWRRGLGMQVERERTFGC